jgi:hypothetical protein
MKISRTAALAIVALGLLLLIAGPLIPGGERLSRNDPPRTGHVTDLARADDGSILAGTQDGELWRLADGAWTRVDVDLGGQPVTALSADLSGDPAEGPIGTGGGLVNTPPGLPPLDERIADEWMTSAGLVVATGEGVHIQGDGTWQRALTDTYVYRLEPQSHDGADYLHAGTIDQGVLTARVDDLLDWQPNRDGLPDGTNVFSFVTTAGNRLVAGTEHGLHWQPAPMQPWQPLKVGLENSRMLSLHLFPPDADGRQRLWIGSDDGLWSVYLTEDADGVAAAAYADLMEAPPDHVRYGVSWIVPYDEGVLFSAGAVYYHGPMGFAGWVWISLAGVIFILLGGFLFPGRNDQEAKAA